MKLQTCLLAYLCLNTAALSSCAESPVAAVETKESDPSFADRPASVLILEDAETKSGSRASDAGSSTVGATAEAGLDANVAPTAPPVAAVDAGGSAALPGTMAPGAPHAAPPNGPATPAPNTPNASDRAGSADAPQDALRSDAAARPMRSDAGVDAKPPAPQPCAIPADARLEDVSRPTTVVGNGSPTSCTSRAFVDAVAKGGIITFDCGPQPVTIAMEQTARIFNDRSQKVVIDGGGRVTLSGEGRERILYMNTCDPAQVLTTSHCESQEFPQLTVQNLTFRGGSARAPGMSGGAIHAQGGRLKILNSNFYGNDCAESGAEAGGGAVRAATQFEGRPVYVVNSNFGGEGERGNSCSNGGALSGSAASFHVVNSRFRDNRATGSGANPPREGTPGGGSGGALFSDGIGVRLTMCGSTLHDNRANEGGGAIFFVSVDRSGPLTIERSLLERNLSAGFESQPGIFAVANGEPAFHDSTVR
jgi:hypothetical protein